MTLTMLLPRTTERPMRKSGDEPRTNSVMRRQIVLYPAQLERGEFSGLPASAVPQIHGRKPVVRGLQRL